MDGERRGDRLRSLALGGIVGAAGAIAAARRLTPPSRRRRAPGGLAAFEDAPCFLEIVEREAQLYREGGEISSGRSKPE